ncbi:MAG: hypothetical protein AABX08_03010 [Nanoarchaeota archaeon]
MKRGQIEIIGLLMVVILISVIMLVALWFIIKPESDSLTVQRKGIEGKSILLTLMQTNYDRDRSFKDMIVECSKYDLVDAEHCNNSGVKDEIEVILNLIFNNKEYAFEIKKEVSVGNFISVIQIGSPITNPCRVNNVANHANINVDVVEKVSATLVLCSSTF